MNLIHSPHFGLILPPNGIRTLTKTLELIKYLAARVVKPGGYANEQAFTNLKEALGIEQAEMMVARYAEESARKVAYSLAFPRLPQSGILGIAICFL